MYFLGCPYIELYFSFDAGDNFVMEANLMKANLFLVLPVSVFNT
jgi:hypothetical protein